MCIVIKIWNPWWTIWSPIELQSRCSSAYHFHGKTRREAKANCKWLLNGNEFDIYASTYTMCHVPCTHCNGSCRLAIMNVRFAWGGKEQTHFTQRSVRFTSISRTRLGDELELLLLRTPSVWVCNYPALRRTASTRYCWRKMGYIVILGICTFSDLSLLSS